MKTTFTEVAVEI